jgi:ketosteroid isomerase-like protein
MVPRLMTAKELQMNNGRDVVDRYFGALTTRDLTTVRTLLHDDLTFTGPMATLASADDYLRGLEHITAGILRMERRGVVGDGNDIVQIYDVVLNDGTVPVAEWLRLRDRRIASIEMMLDPRPFAGPAATR